MDPTDLGPGTATWLNGAGTVLLGGFIRGQAFPRRATLVVASLKAQRDGWALLRKEIEDYGVQ